MRETCISLLSSSVTGVGVTGNLVPKVPTCISLLSSSVLADVKMAVEEAWSLHFSFEFFSLLLYPVGSPVAPGLSPLAFLF